ncbi:RNA-binding protein 12B-like [Symphorus nematophorus]
MTIILRLQGLDVKAGTEDIRTFFRYLHIPDGGVYILGGSLREAFIAFSTEKDAKLALQYTGKLLKGSKVTLHISNMQEMEHKLESLLKRKKPSPTKFFDKGAQPSPDTNGLPLNTQPGAPKTASRPPTAAWSLDPKTADLPPTALGSLDPTIASQPTTAPWSFDPRTASPTSLCSDTSNLQVSDALDSSTAFLLGVCTVLQSLQSSHQRENNEAVPRVDLSNTYSTVVSPEKTLNSKPGYVRLFGLPASTTKEDICHFFRGLAVQEAIVNIELGHGHGCLVKFASEQDACDALHFNQQLLGTICVEVRTGTEKMWTSAVQECEHALDVGERLTPKQSLFRETANHKHISTYDPWLKRQDANRLPPKPPKKPRLDGDSTTALSPIVEHTVMVSNLPKTMTKTEIKELLGCPNIAHKNVLHLLDKEGNRTDTAFLIFNRTEDYDYALNLTGCHVGSDAIEVKSVTKEMMRNMIGATHPRNLEPHAKRTRNPKRKHNPSETTEDTLDINADPTAQTCLFVSNMPANVKKGHLKGLFCNFRLKQNNITLLRDRDGKSIGEAVVQFKSHNFAAQAQRLHGRDFLGTKVLLTRINVKQMEDILVRNA